MAHQPEPLQKLHELLLAAPKSGETFEVSKAEEGHLTVWAAISGEDEVLIRIEPDRQNPGKFTYTALTNKFFSNPEKYLKVEVKDNVTAPEVLAAVDRIIANKKMLQIPQPLID